MNYKNLIWALLFSIGVFSSCKKSIDIIPDDYPGPPSNLPERVIKDTTYGAHPKQKLDIYLPARRNSRTKIIMLLHGGGWVGGDKAGVNNFVSLLKSKWPEAAIANMNYRYANGTTVKHDDMMADIQLALALLVNNKTEFSISNEVALMGNSAGGHLALMYAYVHNQEGYIKCVADLYGPAKLNDWEWYNVSWPSVAEWLKKLCGEPWNEPLYVRYSPLAQATTTSVPTAIFHSKNDIAVPVRHSQLLKAKLDALNVPNVYKEYELSFHEFNDADNDECVSMCVNFFKEHMK